MLRSRLGGTALVASGDRARRSNEPRSSDPILCFKGISTGDFEEALTARSLDQTLRLLVVGSGRAEMHRRFGEDRLLGIVRDPQIFMQRCATTSPASFGSRGYTIEAAMPSPIVSGDGYREFLIIARREAP